MAKKQYRVLRAHDGDRWYDEGDTRTAVEAEVAHLVPNVLRPIGDGEKNDQPLSNKMERSPANKATGRGQTKQED